MSKCTYRCQNNKKVNGRKTIERNVTKACRIDAFCCCNVPSERWLIPHSLQIQPPEMFYKKGIYKYFAKFTGIHLCQSIFLNKVAGSRPAILLKKRL